MPSLRRLNAHAGWCSNYEFEDVVAGVDDVETAVLEPGSAFELRQRVARSVAWRGRHRAFGRLNPGVRPIALDRDYDLFAFICMNVWDLLYLNAISGWRERCRVKVCYMVEFYSGQADEYRHLLQPLTDFDHVIQSFSTSAPAVSRAIGSPVHHVALAADVKRFTPWPRPPPRVVDVFSVGRRSEPVHEELLRVAASNGIFYIHDTIPGSLVRPSRPAEHRQMLANYAKRSRCFIAFPAKFGDAENQGQSEVGARYYEGAAGGAVLLGQAPTAPAFRQDFPWDDAVVETRIDGTDVAARLAGLGEAEVARMGLRNAVHALRRHDWAHRWRSILALAGLPARPALAERLGALEALATQAEASAGGVR